MQKESRVAILNLLLTICSVSCCTLIINGTCCHQWRGINVYVVNTSLSNPDVSSKMGRKMTFSFVSAYQKKPNKMQLLSMPLQFMLLFYLAIMSYFSNYTRRRPI
jgi:hypothetical protein